jgi:F0F1-type ATP synthase assembly protein I
MPVDNPNDPDEERDKGWPAVPDIPDLPEAPLLKPNLPRLDKRSARQIEGEDTARRMGLAYVLPTALIAPIVLLTLAGWWLDDHFHLSPYCTLGGALLGTVTGFINMIRIAGKMDQ